jgi:hypothetical protein
MLGGILGTRITSYTWICRRQKELNIPLEVKYSKDKPVDIAIDSTGIKAFNMYEWIRQKWAVRMGLVKLHNTKPRPFKAWSRQRNCSRLL